MEYIIITNSFKKILKKVGRYFSEQDIIDDAKDFAGSGLRNKEAYLKSFVLYEKKLSIVKLRIVVRMVKGRYLLAIIESQQKTEYMPIIIDLKKGKLGQNLSFKAEKKVKKTIQQAIENSLIDHETHTTENPTMDIYEI